MKNVRTVIEEGTSYQSAFLQKIIDAIPQPIFFKNKEGRYLGCNKAFEILTMLSKKELLEENVQTAFPIPVMDLMTEIDKVLLERTTMSTEQRTVEYMGRILIVNKSSYLNADGSIEGTVGVINDVTELKENQLKLQDSQERFKALISSIQDMVLTLDVEGYCTGFYGQWAVNAGLLDEIYIGKKLEGVLGDSYEEFENNILKTVLAGKPIMYDCVLSSVLGGKQAQFSLSPIYGEEGQVIGVVGVGRDVTVQKIALEALWESENLHRGVVETTPYGIIVADMNGKIQMINQQSALLHEFDDPEEMMGQNILTLVETEEHKRMQGVFSRTLKTGKVQKIECTLLKSSGSSFIGEVMTSLVLDAQGLPKYVINVERDITHRKNLEETLKMKNDELQSMLSQLKVTQMKLVQQEKLAGIGQLAAGVAHEINNPLGFVISNYASLKNYVDRLRSIVMEYRNFKKNAEHIQDNVVADFIKRMNVLEKEKKIDFVLEDIDDLFQESNDGLERVGKIVTGLRTFARIDQETSFQEYDLNAGIRNTLIVAKNEIKYWANVEETLGEIPAIEAIGSYINQVLLNIIVNAGQAIKEKQMDKLGMIKLATYTYGEYVYCEIADDGVGISEENRQKVFEPFFTTKPIGQGTGLGLSISHDIVINKHHGEIILDSTVGIGTVFIMKLPIKQKSMDK